MELRAALEREEGDEDWWMGECEIDRIRDGHVILLWKGEKFGIGEKYIP